MSKASSLNKSKDDEMNILKKKSDSESNSVKRKKSKKKTNKHKASLLENLMKKRTEPIIIDELNKTRQFVFKLKKIIPPIKITFIYKKKKFNVSMNHKSTLYNLKETICENINIPKNNFEIFFNDLSNSLKDDNELIKNIIKNSNNPVFEVKKKRKNIPLIYDLYYKKYGYKMIIEGIKNLDDLKSQIDIFFEQNLIIKDYICEFISEEKYLIGFNSPNIIFDFKRKLQILQLTNNLYKNIKILIKKDYLKLKRNKSYFTTRKKRKFNYSPYLNYTSPYITYEEMRRKEQLENKKKWICKDDFISAAGNHSVDKYYMDDYGFL